MRGCSCRGTAGFAHVSCLAEEAKILVAEAEENNLDWKAKSERWARWYSCGLCEQPYHGVVKCALGWACWKTYVGRPEKDVVRMSAMTQLGNGLSAAEHDEDALIVEEAELSMLRRVGAAEENILGAQGNLAGTYQMIGRLEQSLNMYREVYSGRLKFSGEEHVETLRAANNYASLLIQLKRFEEAKSLVRRAIPVARRGLGGSHELTLKMRWTYGQTLYRGGGSTLDDLREAVTTYEEIERTARRILGGAHPLVASIELGLRDSRAVLAAREASARLGALAL